MSSNLPQALRTHWAMALLATAALALLLTNLGGDYLWADEGDTAVLASNVVKFGVPKAWDGVTFTDSDRGARVNDQLVMVSHTWLQYYVAAGSFAVFGENTFAARLPFALAGWCTILLVYVIAWRVSADRVAAFCSAILVASSVQFLLYARQCRYYALSMLLTCALLFVFFRLRTARQAVLFTILAALLFHAHPIGFVVIGAFAIATLVHRSFADQRRWFWFALPAILLLTLPWLMLAPHGHSESAADLRTFHQFVTRLAQFTIESTSVTPLIGCVILLLCGLALYGRRFVLSDEAGLLLVVALSVVCYVAAMVATQSAHALWYLGVRYTPAIIPLVAMAAGILISRISRRRAAVWVPLLAIFAFTKLAQLTPWIAWSHDVDPPSASAPTAFHVPTESLDRFVGGGQWLFVSSLRDANPGTVGAASAFLQKNAARGDVFITNYEWDPLYFHTRLPQGLKILPKYPIAEAAHRHALPEYTFDVTGVRWVLWRPAWDGYLEYRGTEVEQAIGERGGRVEQVAEFAETVWENRENIHFRRFAGGRYLFPRPADIPAARLFKVEWP